MKSFKITCSHWPHKPGIACAETRGKACFSAAETLFELSYAETMGAAFSLLTVHRAPEFDAWAQAQTGPRQIDIDYAQQELDRLNGKKST